MSMQKLAPRRASSGSSGESPRLLSAQEVAQVAGGYFDGVLWPYPIELLPYPWLPPQGPYPGPIRTALP